MTAVVLSITADILIYTVTSTGNQEWTVNISSSTSNPFHYYWNKVVGMFQICTKIPCKINGNIWIGSGHGALLLRADWRQYMEDAHIAINFSYICAHGTLDDDVGSVNSINGLFSFNEIAIAIAKTSW